VNSDSRAFRDKRVRSGAVAGYGTELKALLASEYGGWTMPCSYVGSLFAGF
jgi:hypothetical protein